MPLSYSMNYPEDEWRFISPHWTYARTADNKTIITLTGVVILHLKGTGGSWLRDRVILGLRLPSHLFPAGQGLLVEYWAPFVTLNAISNKEHAVNAGWAIDAFGFHFDERHPPNEGYYMNSIPIWADLAVRDIDGYLLRLGYHVTVVGVLGSPPRSGG